MSELQPPSPPPGFRLFALTVKELIGLDLTSYNPRQLYRRLEHQLSRVGCRDLAEYAALIRRDRRRAEELASFITINVSQFFRDVHLWETLADPLRHYVLDELPARGSRPRLRAWSAGCSVGAEAYSLAIFLTELHLPVAFHILATDVDEEALKVAVAAIYQERELAGLSDERRREFFVPQGKAGWQVRGDLRKAVTFRRHDLLRDPYPLGMDLILCRNVVIYFTPEAKQRVQEALARSLRPGGLLFVGATESLIEPGSYGLEPIAPFLYRRSRP